MTEAVGAWRRGRRLVAVKDELEAVGNQPEAVHDGVETARDTLQELRA